jgi:hypothetical protein
MRLAREKQIGSAAKVQTHRQHFDATFTAPASCIVIPAYRLRQNFLSLFFVPRCSAKKSPRQARARLLRRRYKIGATQ